MTTTETNATETLLGLLVSASAEPTNPVTGRTYTRKNRDILLCASVAGYRSNVWATFKQWQQLGLVVRKGEKGTRLVRLPMVTSETTGEKVPTKGAPKSFFVFAAEQVEPMQDSEDN